MEELDAAIAETKTDVDKAIEALEDRAQDIRRAMMETSEKGVLVMGEIRSTWSNFDELTKRATAEVERIQATEREMQQLFDDTVPAISKSLDEVVDRHTKEDVEALVQDVRTIQEEWETFFNDFDKLRAVAHRANGVWNEYVQWDEVRDTPGSARVVSVVRETFDGFIKFQSKIYDDIQRSVARIKDIAEKANALE